MMIISAATTLFRFALASTESKVAIVSGVEWSGVSGVHCFDRFGVTRCEKDKVEISFGTKSRHNSTIPCNHVVQDLVALSKFTIGTPQLCHSQQKQRSRSRVMTLLPSNSSQADRQTDRHTHTHPSTRPLNRVALILKIVHDAEGNLCCLLCYAVSVLQSL